MAGGVALLIECNSPSGIEVVQPTLPVNLTAAVASPGLYTFHDGDQLDDVLEPARGTTGDADLDRVNLALRLRDGTHIHVAAVGEAVPDSAQRNIVSSSDDLGLLNMNVATQEEVERHPDIGAKCEPLPSSRTGKPTVV